MCYNKNNNKEGFMEDNNNKLNQEDKNVEQAIDNIFDEKDNKKNMWRRNNIRKRINEIQLGYKTME